MRPERLRDQLGAAMNSRRADPAVRPAGLRQDLPVPSSMARLLSGARRRAARDRGARRDHPRLRPASAPSGATRPRRARARQPRTAPMRAGCSASGRASSPAASSRSRCSTSVFDAARRLLPGAAALQGQQRPVPRRRPRPPGRSRRAQLLNRWIVPMERRHDYLMLRNGGKFTIPFDMVLVFSTNLRPDRARRRAPSCAASATRSSSARSSLDRVPPHLRTCLRRWGVASRRICVRADSSTPTTFARRPLLACYPRDLLSQVATTAALPGRAAGALRRPARLGLAQLLRAHERAASTQRRDPEECKVMRAPEGLLMLLVAAARRRSRRCVSPSRVDAGARRGDSGQIAVASSRHRARRRISPGACCRMVEWPSGSVPPGRIHRPGGARGPRRQVSHQRGEPLIEAKLAPVGTKGGLSAVVAEGKRAMTVRVNDVDRSGRLRAARQLRRHHGQHAERRRPAAATRTRRSARSCSSASWCSPSRRRPTATRPSRRSSTP